MQSCTFSINNKYQYKYFLARSLLYFLPREPKSSNIYQRCTIQQDPRESYIAILPFLSPFEEKATGHQTLPGVKNNKSKDAKSFKKLLKTFLMGGAALYISLISHLNFCNGLDKYQVEWCIWVCKGYLRDHTICIAHYMHLTLYASRFM